MLGFGMPELIMIAVIAGIIVFGIIIKSKGGSAFVSIIMILIGIGMIVFNSTCFKDVPFKGTVFMVPGENIVNAKMADPMLRYALVVIGGFFTAFGIFLQMRVGFNNTKGPD